MQFKNMPLPLGHVLMAATKGEHTLAKKKEAHSVASDYIRANVALVAWPRL